MSNDEHDLPNKADPPDLLEPGLPDDEPPHEPGPPPGLRDHVTPGLFAWVRAFLNMCFSDFCDPVSICRGETLWQWTRFELLDWLRPIEKLLRRILLIEAFALLETQSLPPVKPPQPRRPKPAAKAGEGTARPDETVPPGGLDPDHPERWRAVFRIMPPRPRAPRRHRRLPVPRDDNGREISPRFRVVVWSSMPIALRLEAVVRVCRNPAPFIRRLAFRLRAAGRSIDDAISRLSASDPRALFARDANSEAIGRLGERYFDYWSSS